VISDVPDPTPSNDSATVLLEFGSPDLSTGVEVIGDPNVPGSILDIFVTVRNVGAIGYAGPVSLVIPLPGNMILKMGQSGWDCVDTSGVVRCTSPGPIALDPEQSLTIGIWTIVTGPPTGVWEAFGSVGATVDTNPANDVSSTPLASGGPIADVSVGQSLVTQAAGAVYRLFSDLRVTNAGPSGATRATLAIEPPAGMRFVRALNPAGSCAGGMPIVCDLGTLDAGAFTDVALELEGTLAGRLVVAAYAFGAERDPVLANNKSTAAISIGQAMLDLDADGMPTAWELQFGLDPATPDGVADPDGDGLSNLAEYQRGSHPRGVHRRYFAEGASNAFFATELAVLNPGAEQPANLLVELMTDTGDRVTTHRRLAPRSRAVLPAADLLGGRTGSFATLIESDVPIAADRSMTWGAGGYGSSTETGMVAPSTRWLFAEGATHGAFHLFYLLQNPDLSRPATVRIRYLRPVAPPIIREYALPPRSRLTVVVDTIAGLESTDVAAEILSTNGVAIVAERAMYRDVAGQPLGAGHAGAGATEPESSWYFAEGATGAFFDTYLLLANPGATPATVTVTYQLRAGPPVVRTYTVAPASRRTVSVEQQDARLAADAFTMHVVSDAPIVAERAMWWPGTALAPEWYEAHVSLGLRQPGRAWAVAGGASGGTTGEETYVLIANQATTATDVRLTVVFDDGTSVERQYRMSAESRLTVPIAAAVLETGGRQFSVLVEDLTGAAIVVECSRYGSAGGTFWSRGASAAATRLP
jgi:hypothetical protein